MYIYLAPTYYKRQLPNMPNLITSAFVGRALIPCQRTTCSRPLICMRKGPPKKKKSTASSRLPPDERARFEDVLGQYGLPLKKPGDQLDELYTQKKPEETKTFYQTLAGVFGVPALEVFEKALFVVLGTLLIFLITGGLLISSEAFFKVSGQETPAYIDYLANTIEKLFSPALVMFLLSSSFFGIYKQSQLASGSTSYSELRKKNNKNK